MQPSHQIEEPPHPGFGQASPTSSEPVSLRRQQRDLSALLFEARALARAQIMTRVPGVQLCHECLQALREDAAEGHTPECRVGAVMRRLVLLCEDRAEVSRLASPERRLLPPSSGLFAEPKHYNEPWNLRGARDPEDGLRTIVTDRNGVHIVDTADGDCGESMQAAFARRIQVCVTFCAGMQTDILEEILAKYGLRGFALMAFPVERFPVGVLAAIRAFLDADARRVAEQACTAVLPSAEDLDRVAEEARARAATCAAPECGCDGGAGCASDRARASTAAQVPPSPVDAAVDRGPDAAIAGGVDGPRSAAAIARDAPHAFVLAGTEIDAICEICGHIDDHPLHTPAPLDPSRGCAA